ncbi:MAG: SBBP repeat-containing protein, partial [Rhodothermales bacterium]
MKREPFYKAWSRLRALLICSSLALAPVVRAQYVYTHGGVAFDEGTDVGLDAAGNAYFIGDFNDTIDFDPGSGTAVLSSNPDHEDVYVVSYDVNGDLRFAFRIGNRFETSEAAGGIAVDSAGAFYVTGSQPFGSIDYDPDPDSTESRTGALFVASYENDGEFRFAVTPTPANPASSGAGTAIAVDRARNVYITGRFAETIDFDPDSSGSGSLTSVGSTDLFVASYDTIGAYRFAFRLGGIGADQGLGIAADDAGNVYVTGQFRETVAFDPEDTDNDGDRETRTAAAGT